MGSGGEKWPVADGSALADTFAAWKAGVLFPLSKMTRDLLALFDNGITFTDHINAAIIDIQNCVHGQEALFIPPKKMKVPLTFIPIKATTAAGVDLPIAAKSGINFAVKFPNGALRKDGNLGITVQYELQHTKPALEMYRSTVQSIPNGGADTTLVFDTVTRNTGGVITQDAAGTWRVSENGYYLLRLKGAVESATYTAVEARWFVNGAVVPAATYLPAPFTAFGTIECGGPYPLTPADSLVAQMYQTNGAAVARNTQSGFNGIRASISRLYNDTLPTATVRGILVGA